MLYSTEQKKLTSEQKEVVGLLSAGTFLEYFDLMLYVHMGVLFNELFFPKTDLHTSSLLAASAFCSTYIFRPIGALFFGWLGDTIGRKSTVIITTFLMSASCVVMATLPTYAQIGITAAWIVTICRIVQGISSMGELIGAEIYITETVNPPIQYVAILSIVAFSTLGGMVALGAATLVTSYGFNWRAVFWFGAGVALVGSIARTTLRETPAFANAKNRIKKNFEKTDTDKSILEANPIWQEKASKKTSLALLLMQSALPVSFYFVYIYSGHILKARFSYTATEIIHHNFIVVIFQFLGILILTYLSYRMFPLLLLKIRLIIFSIFTLIFPLLLNNFSSPFELLIIQVFIVLFWHETGPAAPILYKSFPIFKRFTYVSVIHAVSRAIMYVATSFGMTYLIEYCGNWGLLILLIPVNVGFAFGLSHFENLVQEAKNSAEKKMDSNEIKTYS